MPSVFPHREVAYRHSILSQCWGHRVVGSSKSLFITVHQRRQNVFPHLGRRPREQNIRNGGEKGALDGGGGSFDARYSHEEEDDSL